jgi:sulfate permease, SulP family
MAQVATAVVVGVVLLFLTGPLEYLPTCVLGVLVFLVALRLIDFEELKNIRSESPQEYALAVMTAAVVVLVGVEEGIVLAMVVSLLRVVRHSYHPHSGVLQADGRNLEAGAGCAECGDRARAGALPVWRGAFLRQCRAIS